MYKARFGDRSISEQEVMGWGVTRATEATEDLALTLSEVGAWEGPERRRLDGMFWAPSSCSQGTRLCGAR